VVLYTRLSVEKNVSHLENTPYRNNLEKELNEQLLFSVKSNLHKKSHEPNSEMKLYNRKALFDSDIERKLPSTELKKHADVLHSTLPYEFYHPEFNKPTQDKDLVYSQSSKQFSRRILSTKESGNKLQNTLSQPRRFLDKQYEQSRVDQLKGNEGTIQNNSMANIMNSKFNLNSKAVHIKNNSKVSDLQINKDKPKRYYNSSLRSAQKTLSSLILNAAAKPYKVKYPEPKRSISRKEGEVLRSDKAKRR